MAEPKLTCTDCGHKWTPGESRHEYDHYRGYGAGHHRDVEAVCVPCHHGRTNRRAA
jgi:5-methylcytosine-specific restriction endonuclease McrA